jgi:hypothetical protein
MTTIAALSEIIRVGGWSLRGLGYPFGVAERGIRFIAWTEAVHGGAIRALRLAEAGITASAPLPPLQRNRDGQAGWRLEGRSKHLLEVGPPAIDLLTADAHGQGAGHVALTGTIGGGLLASLTDLAARRGLACLACYRAADSDVVPDGVAASGWLVALPAPAGPIFALGTLAGAAGSVLETLQELSPALSSTEVRRIGLDVEGCREGGADSYIGLTALRPDADMATRLRRAPGLTPIDYAERLAEGYRSGVTMAIADLQHLYALERRTWAPTSERSRLQAGYGRF